jgi:hypothetical protein
MKHQELKQALRLINKVLADSSVGPGQTDQLRKAKRELEAVARSGKLEEGRLFRAVESIANVLMEIVQDEGNA